MLQPKWNYKIKGPKPKKENRGMEIYEYLSLGYKLGNYQNGVLSNYPRSISKSSLDLPPTVEVQYELKKFQANAVAEEQNKIPTLKF